MLNREELRNQITMLRANIISTKKQKGISKLFHTPASNQQPDIEDLLESYRLDGISFCDNLIGLIPKIGDNDSTLISTAISAANDLSNSFNEILALGNNIRKKQEQERINKEDDERFRRAMVTNVNQTMTIARSEIQEQEEPLLKDPEDQSGKLNVNNNSISEIVGSVFASHPPLSQVTDQAPTEDLIKASLQKFDENATKFNNVMDHVNSKLKKSELKNLIGGMAKCFGLGLIIGSLVILIVTAGASFPISVPHIAAGLFFYKGGKKLESKSKLEASMPDMMSRKEMYSNQAATVKERFNSLWNSKPDQTSEVKTEQLNKSTKIVK